MNEDEFVLCSECIYYDECEDKEDVDGCYFGEREEYEPYEIVA